MPTLWIVDRDPRRRAALARLAGATEEAVLGGPGDPLFGAAQVPSGVVLGLAGDFEAELDFAHRLSARLRGAGLVLVAERHEIDRARRLFDSAEATLLAFPPESRSLRQALAIRPAAASGPLPLSRRAPRDALAERFSRWFAHLELPDLLRSLDPRMSDVPLLIRGEPGTGRALLARYVHAFGGTGAGAFAQVSCAPDTSLAEIADAIQSGGEQPRARASLVVCLEDVDQLPAPLQRRLASWAEFGPPDGPGRSDVTRWIATAVDEPEQTLRQAIGLLRVEIPPLRERPHLVPTFANDTALSWSERRSEPARRFGEDALAVLEEYPWPGNLRELEGIVIQTLLATSANPVPADALVSDGIPFAPLAAEEIGVRIPDEDADPLAELDDGEIIPLAEPMADLLPEAIPVDEQELAASTLEHEPGIADARATPLEAREGRPQSRPKAAQRSTTAGTAGGQKEGGQEELRRFVDALAHEVRNPLSTIRTFAELLPERYDDDEFRGRFADLVTQDVRRIEDVVDRLSQLAALEPPGQEAVDVSQMLEDLLEERRVSIHQQHLVVLKELDPRRPYALGDAEQLRLAFEALLNKSLQLVPERGSLYLASRYHAEGLSGAPSLRVLLRFRGGPDESPGRPAPEPIDGLAVSETSLEFAVAEAIVRAHHGALAIQSADAGETVILIDLPADHEDNA